MNDLLRLLERERAAKPAPLEVWSSSQFSAAVVWIDGHARAVFGAEVDRWVARASWCDVCGRPSAFMHRLEGIVRVVRDGQPPVADAAAVFFRPVCAVHARGVPRGELLSFWLGEPCVRCGVES